MALKDLAKLINKITKEKTPEEEFMFLYTETIKRTEEARPASRSYNPSSLDGCMRNLYFKLIGEDLDEGKVDAVLKEIGDSGTDRHERIQDTIQKMQSLGYPVEWVDIREYLKARPEIAVQVVQQKGNETLLFDPMLNLRFMCDGVIKYKDKYYILEIKTEIENKWYPRNKPAPDHEVQVSAYSASLGIRLAFFIYENRNNCAKKPYIVEIGEEAVQRVSEIISTCDGYVSRFEVPPKEENKCKYCKYTQACRKY